MGIIENLDRIEQGKISIISTIKRKGVNIPNGILINEIAPYINEIQGGSGLPDEPSLPEVAENEDILAIENVDEVEGTVFMNNPNNISIQYSTNGSEFNDYTTATEVHIGVGEKVYFKWSDKLSNDANNNAIVNSTIKYNVSGELKKGNNEYAYCRMFNNQTNLTDASQLKLTATTLVSSCYQRMFSGCSVLTTAPTLPAMELASNCYRYMFSGCSALTTAPTLPAMELASYCYDYMFSGCSSLTTAPELPATTLATWCYRSMFQNCTSLTTAPQLPATTLEDACYSGMFMDCSRLTTVPTLPATTLAPYCYDSMFYNCTSLTTAPELPATTLADSCYQYMFGYCSKLNYVKHNIVNWDTLNTGGWLNRVASSGTVECPANSTIPSNNISGVPSGWTRVDF